LPVSGNSLNIQAHPHKNELMVGEPLIVKVDILNEGDKKTTLRRNGGKFYSNIPNIGEVFIDGDKFRYGTHSGGATVRYEPLTLKPKEQITEFYILVYNGHQNRLLFAEPKSYQLHLEFPGGQSSNTFQIEVKKANKKADKKLLSSYLRKNYRIYGNLVQAPWLINLKQYANKTSAKKLEQITNEHSKSEYSLYISLSLARNNLARLLRQDKKYPNDLINNTEMLLDKTDELSNNSIIEKMINIERKKLEIVRDYKKSRKISKKGIGVLKRHYGDDPFEKIMKIHKQLTELKNEFYLGD
jgi:hypothetical protein